MLAKITTFGDTGLLAPLALLVLVCLVAQRQAGAAAAWMIALAACAALTVGSKLGFHMCGDEVEGFDIRSPSGHTSASVTVYGSLAVLIAAGRPTWQKAIAGITAVALAGGIGISRAVLSFHTRDEVVLGFAIGIGCVALFALLFRRAGSPRIRLRWLFAGSIAALLLLGGIRVNFEREIARVADLIGASLDVCR